MKKSIFTLSALLISACVSSPDYAQSLDVWVGANQEALISTWGNPASVEYPVPNQELWTYYQTSPNGQMFCRTTFTLTDGVVNDFAFEGDNCTVSIYD